MPYFAQRKFCTLLRLFLTGVEANPIAKAYATATLGFSVDE